MEQDCTTFGHTCQNNLNELIEKKYIFRKNWLSTIESEDLNTAPTVIVFFKGLFQSEFLVWNFKSSVSVEIGQIRR